MNTQTLERPAVDLLQQPQPKAAVATIVPPPPSQVRARVTYSPTMVKAVLAVTRAIGAINKAGWNDFHKYNYLKWDDVMDRLSVLLPQHGLLVFPNEIGRSLVENVETKNDQLIGITYEFIIVGEDGEEWPMRPQLTAFGRVRDSKNVCDDKAAMKCLTQAEKYFLIHFFKIRTSDVILDSDADGSLVRPSGGAKKPPKPGTAEAKAIEGPYTVVAESAESWATTFVAAIKDAGADEKTGWLEANAVYLDRLQQHPPSHKKVQDAISAKWPGAPKPPKPGAPAANGGMPDPQADTEAWLAWLQAKLATFSQYDAGSTFWAERVDVRLLPEAAKQTAMAIWRAFEERTAV